MWWPYQKPTTMAVTKEIGKLPVFLFVLLTIATTAFTQTPTNLIKSTVLWGSSNTTSNNLPAAGIGRPIDFNWTIALKSSNKLETTRLYVEIILPHINVTTQSDCKTSVSSVRSCATTGSTTITYMDVNDLNSTVSVTATGVSFEKTEWTQNNQQIIADFGFVNISANAVKPSIEILFVAQFTKDAFESTVTSFRITGNVQGRTGKYTYSSKDTLDYACIRPVFDVSISKSPQVLGSKVTSTIALELTHNSASSVDNTTCKVVLSQSGLAGVATYSVDLQYKLNGGSSQSVNQLALALPAGTIISNTDKYQFSWSNIGDVQPELGVKIGIHATITCDNPEGGPQLVANHYFTQSTPSITFSNGVDDFSLPNNLGPDTTYTIKNSFRIPVGTLKDFLFVAEFESDDLSPIPINLLSSRIENPDAVTVAGGLTKLSINADGFVVSSRRKRSTETRVRRAATTKLKFVHNVGTMTNFYKTPNSLLIFTATVKTSNPPNGGTFTALNTYFSFNNVNYYMSSGAGSIYTPELIVTKTAKFKGGTASPAVVVFTVTVKHAATSGGSAYSVALHGGNNYFDVFWTSSLTGPALTDLQIVNNRNYIWQIGTLANTDTKVMTYEANIDTNADQLPAGDTWINATVYYQNAPPSTTIFSTTAGCCVERKETDTSNLFTNHGFTVMSLIFGTILGLLIVLIIMFIVIKVCRKVPFVSKEYDSVQVKSNELAVGGGLVTDYRVAKQGLFSARDVERSIGHTISDSIVYIIAKPDKMKVYRELDDRDIKSTIVVDTKLEEERDTAMKAATVSLILGLKTNGDISQASMDKCVKSFKKKVGDMERKTEDDFKSDLENAYKRRSAKNRESLADLLSRQGEDEEEFRDKTANMDPEERDELAKLMKKKSETEKNELMYRLKLEQEEETEKIRKEHSIRRRMGLKEIQQETLDDVKKEGQLNEQQADWLMKNYLENQAGVDKLFDEEVARQRMQLEEKLARRRELAQRAEIQDDQHAEILNTMANQQRQAVNKLKKEGMLSKEEAHALIENAEKEMLASKNKMDLERTRQETDMQKKLSDRKKQRIEETMKRQEQEKAELQKKHNKAQADAFVDPMVHLEEEQKLASAHRQEMDKVENDIDKEHVEELLQLRDKLVDDAKKDIDESKVKLFNNLEADGMSEDLAAKIMSKHKKDMEKLDETHEDEKAKQQKHFEKALKRRRAKYNAQREEEQKEQVQLREQEGEVVRNLMNNQVAMSETERDRIMKEHEKQMVKLENSLTLNKLQQKKMLEERLAKKRAEQMEKLQKKQYQETKKVARQQEVDSDMDEDDKHNQELNMMRKHAEQSIAVLQGEKIEIEDEMDAVRDEMLKERAAALEEQEVKLGAMLAKLQMDKAKEMSRIEEQQKAILNLKSNLMDDLNEKGILSDPMCQQVIEKHNKDQEKLKKTLDAQRSKQEQRLRHRLDKRLNKKEELLVHQQRLEMEAADYENEALRKRLQDRLALKEKNLASMQESQLKEMAAEGNSPAARIRRVALKQKHLLEMEQFRNRIEKEITQTLEEDRRQYDMRRLKDMQDQEIQFINGLVRLGKFKMEELENVTAMLFPLKTETERKALMDQLTEGYKAREDSGSDTQDDVDGRKKEDGTLLERVKSARFERAKSASLRSARGRKTKGKRGLGSKLMRRREVDRDKEELLSSRPDPLGRSNSPVYESDEGRRRRPAPSSRLPPLSGRKKKVKHYDDDHHYRY